MNSIEFPEMNYKHFREKNAKFHIFLLLSIMGGISLITIYDRKFRHNRPEEGLPKMITYISPINMVAQDNHLYFAYKFLFGVLHKLGISTSNGNGLCCTNFGMLHALLVYYRTIWWCMINWMVYTHFKIILEYILNSWFE